MSSTDADGAFSISGLAPGQYAVDAHAGDGAEGMATGIEAGAKSVTIIVERAGAIAGKLVGFTKTPVVYATIALVLYGLRGLKTPARSISKRDG